MQLKKTITQSMEHLTGIEKSILRHIKKVMDMKKLHYLQIKLISVQIGSLMKVIIFT